MRHSSPWYREQTDSWYVTIRGVQHFLGKHPDGVPPPKRSGKTKLWNPPPAIATAFHDFMSHGKVPTPDAISVAKVRKTTATSRSEKTFRLRIAPCSVQGVFQAKVSRKHPATTGTSQPYAPTIHVYTSVQYPM